MGVRRARRGSPPNFTVFSAFFLSLFVHYFLENVIREPPITPKRGILTQGLRDTETMLILCGASEKVLVEAFYLL